MTLAELQTGDEFYFVGEEKSYYTFVGLWHNKYGTATKGRCVPLGRLYPLYFKLNKEIIIINQNKKTL